MCKQCPPPFARILTQLANLYRALMRSGEESRRATRTFAQHAWGQLEEIAALRRQLLQEQRRRQELEDQVRLWVRLWDTTGPILFPSLETPMHVPQVSCPQVRRLEAVAQRCDRGECRVPFASDDDD